MFAIIPSIIAAILILGGFVGYFLVRQYKEIILFPFLAEILVVFCIFYILYRKKYREFLKGKFELRKNILKENQGYLAYSQPLVHKNKVSVPDTILGCFHREKKAVYQKVFFIENENNSHSKYFYCIITEAKLDALKVLYNVDVEYRDIGVFLKSMKLTNGVPLRIITGKNSNVLKEIQPVSDFEYSKEQLSAINSFNVLLLDKEKNVRLEDRRLVDGTEKKKKEKKDKLIYTPLYLLWKAFVCVCFCNLIFLFIYSFILFILGKPIYGIENLKYIIVFLILIPVCYMGISIPTKNFYYCFYGSDLNQSNTVNGYFITAYTNGTRNGFSKDLSKIFPGKNPAIYQIRFKMNGIQIENKKVNQTNTLNVVLTSEKISNLRDIYKLDVRRAWSFGNTDSLGLDNIVEFYNEVPLTITCQEKSNILQKIAPAEDYEYTEEQLAAIEKFNTLYP